MLKKLLVAALASCAFAPAAWAQKDFVEYDTDLELAALAAEYPGFAGYYFDRDGSTVLMLSEATARDALIELIRKRDVVDEDVKDEGGGDEAAVDPPLTGVVNVREVKYDFGKLYQYKQMLAQTLSEPGAVFLDLDEVNNRILIGVEREGAAKSALFADIDAAPQRVAERYSVPVGAVAVTHTAPIRQGSTLQSRLRPAPGGMQITFGNNFRCTMGVVVQRGTINGFLTNSHCTNIQGGVENTAYFQAVGGSSNRIGTEVIDPNYVTGGNCPVGRVCRNSDSALVQFTNNNMGLGEWGFIAKPPCFNCGNLQISTTHPRLRMVYSSRTSPPVGQVVQKVGRTTGWTRGAVSQTCVTINVFQRPQTLFCQSLASAGSASGDSGSAVVVGSIKHRRALRGLLWGGNGQGTFAFSPIGAVENEVGTVDTWP